MSNQDYSFPQEPKGEPQFEPESPQKETLSSIFTFLWETLKIIIISLIIIVPVRYFLVQPFYVKGASMEPNFYDHEYLIIDEISYRFETPIRGDIVVFKYPKNPSDYFIKRVIALPGERVIIENGQVKIANSKNPAGFILDESEYLPNTTKTFGNIDITLGENQYYVLGDNRASSLDSRGFGPITNKDIIGKTWLRGWPFDRFTIFETPAYTN
jgi:signal peptidase I